MPTEIRELTGDDEEIILAAADGLFDHAVNSDSTRRFLEESTHRLVGAIADGKLVGYVSAVIHVRPDKAASECWISKAAVAEGFRGDGIGKEMVQEMLDVARNLGAKQASVMTHRVNRIYRRLYEASGGKEEEEASVVYRFDL